MRRVFSALLIIVSIAIWIYALFDLFGENPGTGKYLIHLACLLYLTGLIFWIKSKKGSEPKVTFWKKSDPDFLGGFGRLLKLSIGLNFIFLTPVIIWSNWWPYYYKAPITIHFYSEDMNNSLTVIDNDEFRFVIPGIKEQLPNRNYAQFDISSIPELGDGVWICWLNNDGWDITIDKTKLVKNDLDTLKYQIHTDLPLDDRGIPSELKYRKQNCAVFDFHLMELSPKTGTIVEIK